MTKRVQGGFNKFGNNGAPGALRSSFRQAVKYILSKRHVLQSAKDWANKQNRPQIADYLAMRAEQLIKHVKHVEEHIELNKGLGRRTG